MKYNGKNGKKESLHLCDLIMAFFLTSKKLTEVFLKKQFSPSFVLLCQWNFTTNNGIIIAETMMNQEVLFMNILHMKYAVEVARLGSLNKAAETLMIATPNISRSIKELEADLGITIFQRSAKGVVLTPDGEEFLDYATEILNKIDRMEQAYRDGSHKKRKFSICNNMDKSRRYCAV